MQWVGTLRITQYESPQIAYGWLYLIVFNSNEKPRGEDVLVYRCRGDAALLRALEDLLEDGRARRAALEQLRGKGQVAVTRVVLPRAVVEKYEPASSSQPRRRLKPACAVCARPVALDDDGSPGEAAGHVVHRECAPGGLDWPEEIASFVLKHAGRPFCHSCLTFLFAIPHDVARKSVGILRNRPGFSIAVRRCAACRRSRLAIFGAEIVAVQPAGTVPGLSA